MRCFLTFLCLTLFMSSSLVHADDKILTSEEMLASKMKWVLPQFKVNGTISEVIEKLRDACKEFDSLGKGLAIVFRPAVSGEEDLGVPDDFDFFEEDDPFAELDEKNLEKKETELLQRKFNFNFKNVPVGEIIRYICLASGLKYKLDSYAVIIADSRFHNCGGVTRFFKLKREDLALLQKYALSGVAIRDKDKLSSYFEALGINFNFGANVGYAESSERLIVTNDSGEIDRLKSLLGSLKGEPDHLVEDIDKKFPVVYQELQKIIPKVTFEDYSIKEFIDFLIEFTAGEVSFVLTEVNLRKRINIDAENIPLGELIKYVCEQLGMRYKVERYAVVIGHFLTHDKTILKFYPFPRVLMEIIGRKKDYVFVEYFKEKGINFNNNRCLKVVGDYEMILLDTTVEDHKAMKKCIAELQKIGIEKKH